MTLLRVLEYPNAKLRTKAKPVETFDDNVATLIDDMTETMHNTDSCAGYAAVQFGIYQRVIVINKSSSDQSQDIYLINPEIMAQEGSTMSMEGCISVPGAYEKIKRAAKITVRTFDKTGVAREFEADDFLACCIQHEIDHLNGILFIDHLSPLKRDRVRRKIIEYKKHTL
jgi:peptide deformylase